MVDMLETFRKKGGALYSLHQRDNSIRLSAGGDYLPRFERRYGNGKPSAKYIEQILDATLDKQLAFLDTVGTYKDVTARIKLEEPDDSPEPRWIQDWFPPLDGLTLYCNLVSRNPRLYIEIGSGNSTKFAYRAKKDHGLRTSIVSIDPEPRAEIDGICDSILRNRLEDVDPVIFKSLDPGDIVFFDGSHRCFQNSDVTAFFIDYLPAFPSDCLVGVHDVFWPDDYPETWVDRYYSEQYVLAAYILALGERFPVQFACAYMGERHYDAVLKSVDPELAHQIHAAGREGRGAGGIGGGAFWFTKPHTEGQP